MSYTTTVILSFDPIEDFEEDFQDRLSHPIVQINNRLLAEYKQVLHPFSEEMKNGCSVSDNIWIGMFSNLDDDELTDLIRSQNWRVKESVEIIFKGEVDENLFLISLT